MIALGMDPRIEKLFCAIGVRHSGNTFRTILLDPTPEGISSVTKEIDSLTEPKVLGCLFRIYDFKAGVSRNWVRPFVPGESVREILLRALQEQDKKESKTMGWFEATNEAAPSALYMAIAWAHEDGRIVNVPFADLARASFAEAELIGEKFFPALVLLLIPGKVDGLEIRSIIIPALGTRERISAAAAVPTAIQTFRQQAITEGFAEN